MSLPPPDFGKGFDNEIGVTYLEVTADEGRARLDIHDKLLQPWGIVHGGVYTSAIESAASVGATTAVRDRGMVAVGLTNTTHFLRSVSAGRAEVEAIALHQGRTQQLWRVDVRDEVGRLLAHGEVRLQNVTP